MLQVIIVSNQIQMTSLKLINQTKKTFEIITFGQYNFATLKNIKTYYFDLKRIGLPITIVRLKLTAILLCQFKKEIKKEIYYEYVKYVCTFETVFFYS